jgi:hypothetical protein
VVCDTSQPIDPIETVVTANTSGLQYDPVADQYTYVWKTPKKGSGCWELELKLTDGTTHVAQFQFR